RSRRRATRGDGGDVHRGAGPRGGAPMRMPCRSALRAALAEYEREPGQRREQDGEEAGRGGAGARAAAAAAARAGVDDGRGARVLLAGRRVDAAQAVEGRERRGGRGVAIPALVV